MTRKSLSFFGMMATVCIAWSSLQANPWIQQHRWLVLGPFQIDCTGKPNPDPCNACGAMAENQVAPHDLGLENPKPGDDWSDITARLFQDTAPAKQWTPLSLIAGPGDIVDYTAIANSLGIYQDNRSIIAVIYAKNLTAADIPVGVCSSSDDSSQVWVGSTIITNAQACRGTAGDCSENNPAVLPASSVTKITVITWNGGGGWGHRLRLIRSDGTTIDDTNAPDVAFDIDPDGAFDQAGAARTIVKSCPVDGSFAVTVKEVGITKQDESVVVTETVTGLATVTDVTGGGVFVPNVAPTPCAFDPLVPAGIFTDTRDIGGPCTPGTTVYDSGADTYVVTGSGNDIWDRYDNFQFAYTKLKGDFSITVHYTVPDRATHPNQWGKYGIMARETCEPDSRYFMTMDCSREKARVQGRFRGKELGNGGYSYEAGVDNHDDLNGNGTPGEVDDLHPGFLKLERVGSKFIGSVSADGATYQVLNIMNWGPDAPCEVFLGLANTSHAGCTPLAVTYDFVELTGGEACVPYVATATGVFDDANDIGSPGAAGSTIYDPADGSYAVSGSGNDIWADGDQFQFAYKKVTGDFTFIAHTKSRPDPADTTNTPEWGKWGVMARQDLSATSRYSMIEDPGRHDTVYALRYIDGNPGAVQEQWANRAGSHPPWLKMERVGNHFYGSGSADGINWTVIFDQSWGPAAPCTAYIGLAVMGGRGFWTTSTIVYDEVSLTGGTSACTDPPMPKGGTITWPATARKDINFSYSVADALDTVSIAGKSGGLWTTGTPSAYMSKSTGPIGVFEHDQDIGDEYYNIDGGSLAYDAATEVYTQVGSGWDIWGDYDRFNFAYKQVTGDFEVTAQILSRYDPWNAAWGRDGLMARQDCSPDSRYSMVMETLGNGQQWPRFLMRRYHQVPSFVDDDAFNYDTSYVPGVFHRPNYQKLVRRGNTFYGYLSVDGVDWKPIGSEPWYGLDPAAPLLVGYAVQRHIDHNSAPIVTYKINYGTPNFGTPIHDSNVADGDVLNQFDFEDGTLDTTAWQANVRNGAFTPQLVDGRLRVGDLTSGATSVFCNYPIDGIDDGIYTFEFDVKCSNPDVNASAGSGFVFGVMGGTVIDPLTGAQSLSTTRVGIEGGQHGWHLFGRKIPGDYNVTTNGFALEFDTVRGGYDDAAPNPQANRKYHLGLNALHEWSITFNDTSLTLPDIFPPAIDDGAGGLMEDPAFLGAHVKVRYNAGKVTVYMKQNGDPAAPMVKYLEGTVVPISFAAQDALAVFGFTSGRLTAVTDPGEIVDIDNLVVSQAGCNQVPEAAAIAGVPVDPVNNDQTVTLDGSGSVGGDAGASPIVSFKWEIVSGPGAIDGANNAATVNIKASGTGEGVVTVKLTVDDGVCVNGSSATASFTFQKPPILVNWVGGDGNGDGISDISDAVALLTYLFVDATKTLACYASMEMNGDAATDISDAVFLLTFLFVDANKAPYGDPTYTSTCHKFESCTISSHCQ